ncbi:MaoC family dehydratase N-terminal domain-containing protein [Amycolatopsis sp. NPDC052450]|uniref:FAS1-like dehydratase domain-containing protein n=1 Tax=Amycolatopsis sp. NPDC052450 TaxID=3363937 RepID=UPI0037C50EFE
MPRPTSKETSRRRGQSSIGPFLDTGIVRRMANVEPNEHPPAHQIVTTFEVEVSRRQIRDFTIALGFPADGLDGELTAPATFPLALTMRALESALARYGAELAEVVHRDQRFAYTRPIHSGDVLTAKVSLSDNESVAKAGVITAVTEIGDRSGNHVCTSTSTIVALATPDRRPG